MTRTDQLVNRHMARLMTDLESAECPAIYRRAVKAELMWLRDDLREVDWEGEGAVEKDVDGNRAGV